MSGVVPRDRRGVQVWNLSMAGHLMGREGNESKFFRSLTKKGSIRSSLVLQAAYSSCSVLILTGEVLEHPSKENHTMTEGNRREVKVSLRLSFQSSHKDLCLVGRPWASCTDECRLGAGTGSSAQNRARGPSVSHRRSMMQRYCLDSNSTE